MLRRTFDQREAGVPGHRRRFRSLSLLAARLKFIREMLNRLTRMRLIAEPSW